MTIAVATAFDPFHPLTRGVHLVEASAGTGKTYNIANLVLRLVAERGIALKRVLVVTFTRAATAELKDRVRRRLADALRVLEARDPAAVTDDAFLRTFRERADEAALTVGDDWTRRVRDALEAFDEAFITTIHGFCQRMLQQHAFESDADFGLELVSDAGAVLGEIVDDFLSRTLYAVGEAEYSFLTEECGFKRDALVALARHAVDDPDVEVVPAAEAYRLEDAVAIARSVLAAHGELAAALVGAVQALKQAGRFKPRQRTYGAGQTADQAAAMEAWVRRVAAGEAEAGAPPEAVAHFFAMDKQLVDPTEPVSEAVIAALRPLVGLRGLAAASRRAGFVAHVRERFDRANASRRVQTFQDLLRGLARRLDAPEGDPRRAALVEAVGARFDAALIDEFQDTDQLQWTLFRTLFGGGGHVLTLIGDPKQAIYGFRGANVHVYLDAKASAADVATMTRNYRSDAGVIAGLNHLMARDGFFAVAGIPYERVDTPPEREVARFVADPGDAGCSGSSTGGSWARRPGRGCSGRGRWGGGCRGGWRRTSWRCSRAGRGSGEAARSGRCGPGIARCWCGRGGRRRRSRGRCGGRGCRRSRAGRTACWRRRRRGSSWRGSRRWRRGGGTRRRGRRR